GARRHHSPGRDDPVRPDGDGSLAGGDRHRANHHHGRPAVAGGPVRQRWKGDAGDMNNTLAVAAQPQTSSASGEVALRTDGITKSYGKTQVLHELSLEVHQ